MSSSQIKRFNIPFFHFGNLLLQIMSVKINPSQNLGFPRSRTRSIDAEAEHKSHLVPENFLMQAVTAHVLNDQQKQVVRDPSLKGGVKLYKLPTFISLHSTNTLTSLITLISLWFVHYIIGV